MPFVYCLLAVRAVCAWVISFYERVSKISPDEPEGLCCIHCHLEVGPGFVVKWYSLAAKIGTFIFRPELVFLFRVRDPVGHHAFPPGSVDLLLVYYLHPGDLTLPGKLSIFELTQISGPIQPELDAIAVRTLVDIDLAIVGRAIWEGKMTVFAAAYFWVWVFGTFLV